MKKETVIIPIAFSKEDRDILKSRADENRLKLSSYLRHQLTKDFKNE